MKKIKYIISLIVLVGLCGCSDWMNTAPEGATLTADQLDAASKTRSEAMQGKVNAMYSQMIALYAGLEDYGYERDNDFGYPSICMITESQGQDFVGTGSGYNWFTMVHFPDCRDNSLSTNNGRTTHQAWNTYYKTIHAANQVIALAGDTAKVSADMISSLGQAQAMRAFCYLQLAQLYQTTYVGSEDKACVPIVTESTTEEQGNNNPRATVRKVYEFIARDLNSAINHLAGSYSNDHSTIDEATAYGLRARMNLLMQNYEQAAEDAQQCLDLSGATSLSVDECQTPGFANATAHNVIWATAVTENNEVTQSSIINWVSHLCTFFLDGYAAGGNYRYISSALYNEIPTTDVRHGWWLDENWESPLLESYPESEEDIQYYADPYANLKFGTKNGKSSGLGAAAGDWIMMRAEEMELIIAECQIQTENNEQHLIDWVQEYRDPSYSGSGDMMNDLWLQRRIELWGEGFAFQDLLRLHKGIERKYDGSNWPSSWQQNISADYGGLIWRIPEAEIQTNKGITAADNNPFVSL